MKASLITLFLIIPLFLFSQEECKVLLPELDSLYKGECKDGLAHGSGEAWGKFHYTGKFKKGLPHGKGRAEYFDGMVYEGSWEKGLRSGKGTIFIEQGGKVIEKTWIWSKGEMVSEIIPPAYKVITKRNIDRIRVYDQGGSNSVWFQPNAAGGIASDMQDIRITGNSGTQTSFSQKIGYESVTFPFKGSIKYYAWNKLRTTKFEIFLEIEIMQPGNWIIEIQN